MEVTRYYSQFIKSHGVPHLNLEQHQRLFNIISLESRLKELTDLTGNLNNTPLARENEYRKFLIRNKIETLTSKKHPKELLGFMLHQSEAEK